MIQGDDDWKRLRAGKVTASRVADVVAKTKSGYGASRRNYAAQLVVERLTGLPTEGFVSAEMRHGTECEPQARAAYQFYADAEVEQIAFVPHPNIQMAGASPDGLVGADGLVEIKCPSSATHIETLLGAPIAAEYITQMQWQMACTGREWCDFVSFDPRMPGNMQIFIQRVPRDDKRIAELEEAVAAFLAEISLKVAALQDRYDPKAVAA